MELKTDAVGKTWQGDPFEVESERISKYASAVGEENEIHHKGETAKEAGFRDVVAPPMFAVV